MAISASSIAGSSTLNELRTQFNNLVTDVTAISGASISYTTLNTTNTNTTILNVKEDGTIVFEGATDNGFETTLTVVDPTADRVITLPDVTGTLITSGGSSFTLADGGTLGVTSSTSAITIASTGIVSFIDDILIKDGGTIGSATDPDAISIGSDGDITLTQDLELQHDGAILSFGANDEVTLTHVHDDGLLLNDDMQLQFRDSAINIRSDADGDLDINADDEIELNSTLIDINGNVEISGTLAQVGVATFTGRDIHSGGITIANDGTIGSVGDADSIAISSAGVVTMTQIPVLSAGLNVSGGTIAGTISTVAQNSITTMTSLVTTGALGSGTIAAGFGAIDNGTSGIRSNTITAETAFVPDANDGADIGTTSLGFNDIFLADAGTIQFGNDQDVILTHVADVGLKLSHEATGDNLPIVLNLESEEDAIISGEEIGRIDFTAGDSGGTDAILTAASIAATAEDTFASDNNSTGLAFKLGVSAAATEMFRMTHDGDFKVITDGSAIGFGANNEIELTHVHNTGLLLTDSGGTPTLQLHDSNESVSSDGGHLIFTSNGVTFDFPSADGSDGQFLKTDGSGVLTFAAASADSLACDNLTVGDAAVVISTSSGNITVDATANDSDIIFKGTDGTADTTFLTIDGSDAGTLIANHNLELGTDASAILFGANNEVILTHVHDKGLALKHTATADDKPVVLTLQTGETDIAADDVIGQIDFQAPDEGTGTDAITVCAGIAAISEGDFAADNNATKLSFKTGASEAATEKMGLSSTGALSVVSTAADGTLQLQSTHAGATGAGLKLYHNSASPADNDIISIITSLGRNDNTQDVNYSEIKTTAIDVSDGTEDGIMGFFTMKAGTLTEQVRIEQDGDLHADGDVIGFSTTVSDVALKSNIEVIPNALDKLDKIKGYTFTRHNGTTSAGIIAQELEKVLPEAVKEKKLSLVDGETYKTVQYDAIHGLLIQAIKELKDEIRGNK